MKIVYFGSDVFLSCFEYLLGDNQILALYTYHNDEDYFTEYSITEKAKKLGIPVIYDAITPERIVKYFKEEGCGLLFVAEYNRIIPIPENLPEFRGMNVHSSLLPQGRSYYPIESAFRLGLKSSGATVHKLAPKLDKGDIISQRQIEITPETDSVDMYIKCAENALAMVKEIFSDFEAHWNSAVPQAEKLPYWSRPDDGVMTLSHEMSRREALEIFKKYNGMTKASVHDKMYYVNGISPGSANISEDVIALSRDRILYRVSDGHLRLHILPTEVI